MKKFFFILIAFLTANLTFGQSNTKENELTKAEKFTLKSGTLFQKEFIDIGEVKSKDTWGTFSINVVIYTDLISNDTFSAIRFENFPRKLRTLVDSDEIDGLISVRL